MVLLTGEHGCCRNCHDISLFKELVAGLPLIGTKGGAPGYKSVGRSRIHDSIIIINTINQCWASGSQNRGTTRVPTCQDHSGTHPTLP
jgi:hypothetical protein